MTGLELVVLLAAVFVVCGVLSARLHLAQPVLLLIAGVVLGFAPTLREVHLPPELTLLVFLPALLYWEALTTSVRQIRANLRGVVLTSTLLVAATAAAVAAAVHALGMAWGPAWVLGAAVAPTDATAVAAVGRILPTRNLTLLRAESLVNDGTALVIYGVAVGVTVGEQTLSAGHLAAMVLLSYVGGIAIGATVAWLGALIRSRVRDPLLHNTVMLSVPFAAYLLAELIGSSGVLGAVVAGLVMSQIGPRIGQARTRQQYTAFWALATFLLNAALFVLVGIEAQAALRNLVSVELSRAVVGTIAIWVVTLAVRYAFLVVAAYTIRVVDRRPQQRSRRVSNRARVVSALSGFRGAVSLAVALSVPTTLATGQPFPDRDIIIFTTAGVVTLTLVVQGLVLPPVVHWARLPQDDTATAERRLAEQVADQEALDALPELAPDVEADPVATDRVRNELVDHLGVVADSDGDDSARRLDEQYRALRNRTIAAKRRTVLRLRDEHRIDDDVLRQLQARLDVEELRLSDDLGE